MKTTFSRSLSALTLIAWGGLLLYFFFSGRLAEYLIPAYRPLVAVSGFIMLGIAASIAWSLRPGARWAQAGGLVLEDRGDDLSSPGRVRTTQALAFALLVLPVWSAVGVSRDQYNACAILNRGVVSDPSQMPGRSSVVNSANSAPSTPAPLSIPEQPLPGETPAPASNASAIDASQYIKKTADGHLILEVTDLLFAADDDSMRPALESRPMEVIGQIMPAKDNDMGGTRFQLLRMFMVCCAADARPVAVAVDKPAAPAARAAVDKFGELGWVRVVGTVSFPVENGRRIPVLHAQSVATCDPPSEAMLY